MMDKEGETERYRGRPPAESARRAGEDLSAMNTRMKAFRFTRSVIGFALLCEGVFVHNGAAQDLPNHVGTWRYHDNTGGNVMPMTKAEAASLRTGLKTIGDIIGATPIASPPTGFDAKVMYSLGTYGACHGCAAAHLPTWMPVLIWPYGISPVTGKPEADGVEPPTLYVAINDPESAYHSYKLSYEGLFDANGVELFIEPRQAGSINGAPLYENIVVIIKRSAKPLWIPVTREEYLRALIRREETNESNPPETRKYVADVLRKELTELAAAERRSPAYIGDSRLLSKLVPENPDAARVVRSNPAIFDDALPRTAPQLITLRFALPLDVLSDGHISLEEDLGRFRLYQIQQTLDYARLKAVVDGL